MTWLKGWCPHLHHLSLACLLQRVHDIPNLAHQFPLTSFTLANLDPLSALRSLPLLFLLTRCTHLLAIGLAQ